MSRLFAVRAKRSLSLYTLPLLVLLAFMAGVAQPDTWSDSWYDASSHAETVIAVLAPLCGALAAWEAGRDRRTGFSRLTTSMARSRLAVAVFPVVITTFAGTVAYVAGVAGAAIHVVGGGPPAIGIVVLGPLCLLAVTSLGYALGTVTHRIATAPVLAIAIYLWLAFVPQASPAWVARLSMVDSDCCGVSERFNSSVLLGQYLVVLALASAALAVLAITCSGLMLRICSVVVVTVLSGVAVATLVASRGTLTVARAVPAQAPCQRGRLVTVCTWPEHKYQLGAAVAAADAVFSGLQSIPGVPRYLYEYGLRPPTSATSMAIGLPATAANVQALEQQFAEDLLPPPPSCAMRGDVSASFPGASVREYVRMWLTLHVNPNLSLQAFPPPVRPSIAALEREPMADQLAWLRAALAAQRDCATQPPPVPS